MASEIPYKLNKTLIGKIQVKYGCPGCCLELENSFLEAGRNDTCPGCNTSYVVPGAAQKREIEQQQAAEKEKKQQESQIASLDAKLNTEIKKDLTKQSRRRERLLTDQDRQEYSNTHTRVRSHLVTIRSHSCYPSLRILINVCFWSLLIVVALVSFISVAASFGFGQDEQVGTISVLVHGCDSAHLCSFCRS